MLPTPHAGLLFFFFNPLIPSLGSVWGGRNCAGLGAQEGVDEGLMHSVKSHLNRAVPCLVTEGSKMIDCCLLQGYNLVLPLRYSPAANKHPAYSEEATVAGEYVNPERLELSRIQGKESGRTREWSGAAPN